MPGIRRDDDRPAAAAGGGEVGAALQLIPPQGHHFQRAVCFLFLGFFIIIYSTVPSHHSADWDLIALAGFFAFIGGAAALMLFTLGADARRVE